MKYLSLVFFTILTLPHFSQAQIEYYSDRIKTMSAEDLQLIISNNIKKAEEPDASPKPIIKQSLELVLAQPDQSRVALDIFSQLQNLSRNEDNFTSCLNEIVDEGIASLKKDGKEKTLLREQNTYLYILNHMVAELIPNKDKESYKKLLEKIRDADISISDPLTSYRLLNSMAQAENPSKYASSVLPKKKSSWWPF